MQIRRSTWIFGAVALGSLVAASLIAPRIGGLGTGPGTALVIVGPGGPLGPSSATAGRVRLEARLDASSLLLGSGDAWLAVTLNADAVAASARAPLNLAVVIDASGSMAGAPLDSAKLAAKELISRLAASDRVALVAYGSYASTLVSSTLLEGDARDRLTRAIEGLGDMGGTNISDGLELARTEITHGAGRERVNRVVLLSDGDANAGVKDLAGLGSIARSLAGGGMSVTAIGLGTEYDEDKMMAIAEHGGGNYYFVESPKQLAEIFKSEFGAMASIVARGTEVEIVPAAGVEVAEVIGYPMDRRDGAVVIRPGDLYGGQERKIVLRLKLSAAAEGALQLANVSLRFADAFEGGALKIASASVAALVVADASLVEASRDREVSAKVETVKMSRKVEEATEAYAAGDGAKATALMAESKADYARAAASLPMDAAPAAMIDELEGHMRAGLAGDDKGGKVFIKKAKSSSLELAH